MLRDSVWVAPHFPRISTFSGTLDLSVLSEPTYFWPLVLTFPSHSLTQAAQPGSLCPAASERYCVRALLPLLLYLSGNTHQSLQPSWKGKSLLSPFLASWQEMITSSAVPEHFLVPFIKIYLLLKWHLFANVSNFPSECVNILLVLHLQWPAHIQCSKNTNWWKAI